MSEDDGEDFDHGTKILLRHIKPWWNMMKHINGANSYFPHMISSRSSISTHLIKICVDESFSKWDELGGSWIDIEKCRLMMQISYCEVKRYELR